MRNSRRGEVNGSPAHLDAQIPRLRGADTRSHVPRRAASARMAQEVAQEQVGLQEYGAAGDQGGQGAARARRRRPSGCAGPGLSAPARSAGWPRRSIRLCRTLLPGRGQPHRVAEPADHRVPRPACGHEQDGGPQNLEQAVTTDYLVIVYIRTVIIAENGRNQSH
jgi:hypothetical protein